MIRRHWLLLSLYSVALAACGRGRAGPPPPVAPPPAPPGSPAAAPTTLDAPIQLAPGESAVLAAQKFEVEFTGIATDSRCPSDVACVWAGEIIGRLAIRNDGKRSDDAGQEMASAKVGDN